MKVELVDRFEAPLADVAQRSSQATFYHTRPWLDALRHAYPSMPLRILVARKGELVLGYMPCFEISTRGIKRLWSSPFGTYGGPVALDDAALAALLSGFQQLRGEGASEAGIVDLSGSLRIPEFTAIRQTGHSIDLSQGFEHVWGSGYNQTKRRQTRKAQKQGVEIEETRSRDALADYYRIYQARCDAWRQRIRYPLALFSSLLNDGSESARLFVARRDGSVVGGLINLYYKRTAIAWHHVTSDGADSSYASALLYSHTVESACDMGCNEFNLGGSLGKQTLIDFKEAIGATPFSYQILRWRSFRGNVAIALKKLMRR